MIRTGRCRLRAARTWLACTCSASALLLALAALLGSAPAAGAEAWSEPSTVSAAPMNDLQPGVALMPDGVGIGVWDVQFTSQTFNARRIDRHGAGMGGEREIAEWGNQVDVTAAGDGALALMAGGQVRTRSIASDLGPGDEHVIGSEGFRGKIDADAGGATVAYSRMVHGDVYVRRVGLDGAPLPGADLHRLGDGRSTGPDVAVSADGTATVIWPQMNTTVKLRQVAPDGSLAGPEQAISGTTGATQVAIDVDDDGTGLAVYRAKGGAIETVRVVDGVPTGNRLPVSNGEGGARPDVTVDPGRGEAVAVWRREADNLIVARRLNPDGTPAGEISRVSTQAGDHPAIDGNAAGDATVLWRDSSTGRVTSSVAQPAFFSAPASWDFDPVAPGSAGEPKRFTIGNEGSRRLDITGARIAGADAQSFELERPEGGCAPGTSLAPGETCDVEVRLRPAHAGALTASLAVDDVTGGTGEVALTTGNDKAPELGAQPGSLDFGNLRRGTTSDPQSIELSNGGLEPLTIDRLSIGGPDAGQFELVSGADGACRARTQLARGETCEVQVRFKPTEDGELHAHLAVDGNAHGSPAQLPLSGTGQSPGLKVTPEEGPYGDVVAGTPAQRAFEVANDGPLALTLEEIAVAGDPAFVRVDAEDPDPRYPGCRLDAQLTPGASCFVWVDFRPMRHGDHQSTLRIAGDDPGSPHEVALTGHGVAPAGTADPAQLDFGWVTTGESRNLPVEIRNTGDGDEPLAPGTFEIDGADAERFTVPDETNECRNARLAVSESCRLEVRFAPDADGSSAARLTVRGPYAETSVPLAGRSGAPSQFSVTPSTLNLGPVVTGSTPSGRVVVRHTGGMPLRLGELQPIMGAKVTDDRCSGRTLDANEWCSFTAGITASAGASVGQVHIPGSATGAPRTVLVHAIGIDAPRGLGRIPYRFKEAPSGRYAGLAVDGDTLFALDASTKVVEVFDLETGALERWFGAREVSDPKSIAAAGGAVFVGTGTKVKRFTNEGTKISEWDAGDPRGIAVRRDQDGGIREVLVADRAADAVRRFSPTGESLGSFTGDEDPHPPVGVAVGTGPDDPAYVIEEGGDTVKVFDRDGSFERAWMRPGAQPHSIASADTIAVGGDRVWLGDGSSIEEFSPAGGLLRSTELPDSRAVALRGATPYVAHAETIDPYGTAQLRVLDLFWWEEPPFAGRQRSNLQLYLENYGPAIATNVRVTITLDRGRFAPAQHDDRCTVSAGSASTLTCAFASADPGTIHTTLDVIPDADAASQRLNPAATLTADVDGEVEFHNSGETIWPSLFIGKDWRYPLHEPGHASFDPVPVGGSSAGQKIKVANLTQGTLTLDAGAFSITGPNADDFVLADPANPECAGKPLGPAPIEFPGGHCEVEMLFRPKGSGVRNAELRVDTGADQVIGKLSGRGLAAPTVSPDPLAFGPVQIHTTADRELTVRNDDDQDIHITDIALDESADDTYALPAGRDRCRGKTLAPDDACTVGVRFSPRTVESHRTKVVVRSRSGDLELQDVSVPVSGRGAPLPQPKLTIQPDPVKLGTVELGDQRDEAVRITNTGAPGSMLHVGKVVLGGPNRKDYAVPVGSNDCVGPEAELKPGHACRLELRFRPRAPGARTATLTIRSNAGDRTVAVTGQGKERPKPGPTPPGPQPPEPGPQPPAPSPAPSPGSQPVNPDGPTPAPQSVNPDNPHHPQPSHDRAAAVVTSKKVTVARDGKGRLALRCPGPNRCAGTARFAADVRVKGSKRTKTVVLATAGYRIAAGRSAQVTVRLTAAGRRELRAARRHAVRSTVTLRETTGAPARAAKVTLALAAGKQRRSR